MLDTLRLACFLIIDVLHLVLLFHGFDIIENPLFENIKSIAANEILLVAIGILKRILLAANQISLITNEISFLMSR